MSKAAATEFSVRPDFLPFSRPMIGQEEIDEVVDSLRSGWITTGPKAERFERDFREFTGARHALALSSATAGLHIGLMALGLEPGDEVITTPLTWAATVNMIELLGGKPIFVDIHPGTLQIDERQVEAAITSRTVGILPVHFGGAPCALDELQRIARSAGLWVFEDAAHGVGTRLGGLHVGTTSALSVFSFHPIKNMTTIEGGVLTFEDESLLPRLSGLRFHGLVKSAWNRYSEGGSPQVEIAFPGFKYNFTDIQAALGIHQLAKIEEFNSARTKLARVYDELFADVPEIGRPEAPSYAHDHTWHLYVIKVLETAGIDRDRMMAELRKRNVGTGLHFRAVHLQPYYADKYPEWVGRLTQAEWVSERICSLPLFPGMTEEDVEYVVAAIKDVLVAG